MQPSHVGKYKIIQALGRGAMGEVFLGEDPYIGRRVAIKVMRNAGPGDAERFLHEARIIGSLSHPNIVLLLEFGFHEERPFLAMEYLEGTSLDVWLRDSHSLDEKLRVMSGLLRALSYAHGRDVLHRDIKPTNVQVTADGHGKLMDFGIARGLAAKLTATGTVMGTPEYMAPEILGDASYSPLSDLFSAGIVFYELLTGVNPFSAKTVAACLSNVLHLDPKPLSEARPELPSDLARIVMACLRKPPQDRPQSAGVVLEVVEKLRRGSDASAGQPGASEAAPAELPGVTHAVAVPRAHEAEVASRAVFAPAPGDVPPEPPPGSLARRAAPWMGGLVVVAGMVALWLGGRGPTPVPLEPTPSQPPAAAEASPIAPPHAGPSEPVEPESTPTPAPTTVTSSGALEKGPQVTASRAALPSQRSRQVPATEPTTAPTPRPAAPEPSVPTPQPTPPPTPAPTAVPARTPSPRPTEEALRRAEAAPVTPEERPVPAITSLSPRLARRGRQAVIEIAGQNLPHEVRVEVFRGRQAALGIRILSQKWKEPGVLRVVLLVASDTPLDVYSVALIDAEGNATNSLSFEVGL